MAESAAFRFPPAMAREAAEALLAEAYASLDAGKLLREALKRQRKAGFDPPGDVQYVCEPTVSESGDGLGVGLATDILLYEEFEGVGECTDLFEDVLGEALVERLEKLVKKWERTHKA